MVCPSFKLTLSSFRMTVYLGESPVTPCYPQGTSSLREGYAPNKANTDPYMGVSKNRGPQNRSHHTIEAPKKGLLIFGNFHMGPN